MTTRPLLLPTAIAGACLAGAAFASAVSAEPLVTAEQPIVYGADNRVDVYEETDDGRAVIARESTVALMPRASIEIVGNGLQVSDRAVTLGQSQGLCDGERFADQPSAAFCSGTLIAPDLVLTAGHCVSPAPGACSGTALVFGYYYDSPGRLAQLDQDDVYSCRRVVAHAESGSDGNKRDYAVIQLDRPATPRYSPVTVRTAAPVGAGAPLAMFGYPSGIPLKIEAGGRVRDPRASSLDYFVATTDSFGGNSGSGVYDRDTLDLIGLLIEGDTDYVSDGSCARVNTCAEDDCGGENILYVRHPVDAFCATGTDQGLCGTSSSCGDGYCAWDEDAASCDADCTAAACGDRVCDAGEWTSCPDDCVVTVPDGWTCDPGWYGTNDGCDCDCGAEDPDCDIDPTCVTGGSALCAAVPSHKRGAPDGTTPMPMLLGLLGVALARRR